MNGWCGGSDVERELFAFADRTLDARPIEPAEYQARRAALAEAMERSDVDAVYLDASRSLTYFTGVEWHPSERLAGALLTAAGEMTFVAPAFERGTFERFAGSDAPILTWQEEASPERALVDWLRDRRLSRLALDPQTPFFRAERLRAGLPAGRTLGSAEPLIDGLRRRKSPAEIALMQRAFDITLEVHRAAAAILRPDITSAEVASFVDRAHRACGVPTGSSFCIVLFGPDTAFPHGVKTPKSLDPGDMVLIDTGCTLHGYHSDLTRTYVFGRPTERQRSVWRHEREAQDVAFEAALPGLACATVDDAVRRFLAARGYGPDYALPGLPHRTGHGLGLDIHEPPYFVRGDETRLADGMCLSIEPMLCIPGEFGIRLEDHIRVTPDGPVWFTRPAASLDDPFAAVRRS